MILLLSTSDTDLLSARASGADYGFANPARTDVSEVPRLLENAEIVVVRLLGGRRAWEDGLDAVLASGRPVLVLGGEQAADAELMELSTVPAGVVAEAHVYLAQGGSQNLTQLHNFLSDAILLTGFGFEAPAEMPTWGLLDRPANNTPADRPTVAVLYYRAHQLAGNTAFVHGLSDAIEAVGGRALPIFCSSLRVADPALIETLKQADALIVTVLAAGGLRPADVGAGGTDEDWNVGALAELDVPILQGLCLTSSRETWAASDDGLSPLDAATQVAIPEFDGRLITVPFSFKEIGADGLISYVADPERSRRVAGIAVKHAQLRRIPNADKRIVVMLSAYPTKHARIGNAVGLDTPASTVKLLAAMGAAGYDIGPS
ncbi:MAG: cobaltochelatase subunit CobN, partial [Pseudonocardiales bacterium]|nr:cobaltochelatase subunit CobN [Pseudonocardiales bacterium]